MIVLANSDRKEVSIEAIEKNGEVHLRIEGKEHSFVVCKRNDNGDPVVGIRDIDTGIREWVLIENLYWQR